MNLIGHKGTEIPTERCPGNKGITIDYLVLSEGVYGRGFYSFYSQKWCIIENLKKGVNSSVDYFISKEFLPEPKSDKLIWFTKE